MNFPGYSPLILVMLAVGAAAEVAPQVELRATGGPLVALWQQAPRPNKPYIAQLFAPGEPPTPLLDDSPPDHFHHHGLMLALGVDDTDFWTEKGVKHAGRQAVVESVAAAAGDGFIQRLRWLATDGTPLLDETRRVTVRAAGTGADAVHWLDWESTLSPAAGRDRVRLWGHHYFGLGMRLLPAWSGAGEFSWQDTAGQTTVRGDEKLTGGGWCAARCAIGGRPVTVLLVDHPANPRPALWFTMSRPFCYLAAALNLEQQPQTLAKGERWTLRYGCALLATPAAPARLTTLAAEWNRGHPFPAREPAIPAQP